VYCFVIDNKNYKFLLAKHRISGLWLSPGGHVDSNELPLVAASRECREELRFTPRMISPSPILLSSVKTIGKTAPHRDIALWYASIYDGQSIRFDKREFEEVKWFSYDEAINAPAEPHLPRFFKKMEKSYRSHLYPRKTSELFNALKIS